jgi:hypothetical protein
VTWSVAGWAITPFQQYRLIELSPRTQNVTLSLNASAIYLGQGAGAGIGALVLLYGSPASLGWVAALCAASGLLCCPSARASDAERVARGSSRRAAPTARRGGRQVRRCARLPAIRDAEVQGAVLQRRLVGGAHRRCATLPYVERQTVGSPGATTSLMCGTTR